MGEFLYFRPIFEIIIDFKDLAIFSKKFMLFKAGRIKILIIDQLGASVISFTIVLALLFFSFLRMLTARD